MQNSLLKDPISGINSGFPLVTPGRLVRRGETIEFSTDVSGRLTVCQGLAQDFADLSDVDMAAKSSWSWTPEKPGMYLIRWEAGTETLQRSVAVVTEGWAVGQITVGAFTAEDFAETIHGAGLSADYYVEAERPNKGTDFFFTDPRWRNYERQFGDAIYPHIMPDQFERLDPQWKHENANWESLSLDEIVERLHYLQDWWLKQGYEPLDRIATYTPCNRLVTALRKCGFRVLHSVVPEQNWSDGDWSINHWGMPTCPFWIAEDDYRKAAPCSDDGVVAITMNHYHVLLPHLTMWGDFVLSPSHFTRWIRAADSGETSIRFRQFLTDTVRGWKSLSSDPFFFVAGFEFGRTFGTANMTAYNHRGLEDLIALSRNEKLVFATGGDVAAYYRRHLPGAPESVYRQRDYWMGVTVNGKPGQAGDSVVIERRNYKAVAREGEALPYLHYDYRVKWNFTTTDTKAPHDFAQEDRERIEVRREATRLHISVKESLPRSTPLVVWDAAVTDSPFPATRLADLEDHREVWLVELPAGWCGEQSISLRPKSPLPLRRDDIWKMQSFGVDSELHTYLHLDAPLTCAVKVPVQLKKKARVDSATRTLGLCEPEVLTLEFGPLQGWYRFWDCAVDDIVPDAGSQVKIEIAETTLSPHWRDKLARHQQEIDRLAVSYLKPGEKIVYSLYCGAQLPLGTRSRSGEFDLVGVAHATLHAHEKSDGVIAFGPGKSFWYHPRTLGFRIDGFPTNHPEKRWKLLLHTFDPQQLDSRYLVSTAANQFGQWSVPSNPEDAGAFYVVEVRGRDINARGELTVTLQADQTPLLHWWKDKGFIAALHALWVIELDEK
jgi:hypothetical protein